MQASLNLPVVGDLKEGFEVFMILQSVSVPSLAAGLPQEWHYTLHIGILGEAHGQSNYKFFAKQQVITFLP